MDNFLELVAVRCMKNVLNTDWNMVFVFFLCEEYKQNSFTKQWKNFLNNKNYDVLCIVTSFNIIKWYVVCMFIAHLVYTQDVLCLFSKNFLSNHSNAKETHRMSDKTTSISFDLINVILFIFLLTSIYCYTASRYTYSRINTSNKAIYVYLY